MSTRPPSSRLRTSGFTLIEVLIVVTLLGFLVTIAVPGYIEYVRRTARSDAQLTLQAAASWLERRYSECNSYIRVDASTNPPCTAVLSAGDLPAELATSPSGGGRKRYTVSITTLAAQSYALQAEPLDAADRCGTLQLSSNGARGVTGPLGVDDCWRR
jgi:type IV pilus assembly protein PilE